MEIELDNTAFALMASGESVLSGRLMVFAQWRLWTTTKR